ncbi:MAG TPA: hypothetical protein VFV99_14455 [Kofleriaceae bacterium]|nr:hypothetical protein [Kofleriaceae bacterium]
MKRALLLAVAACSEPATLEPWQLDHDRVVAVRAEPPHLASGEIGMFDALIAHEGGPTTVEVARNAAATSAASDLFTAVHFNIDHWQIDGPDEARLAAARAELGLPDGAPVPLLVSLEFPGPLYADKTMWLGDSAANPAPPAISYGPDLEVGREYQPVFIPPPGSTVRWLTSCGTLTGDTEPRATHIIEEPCTGELVLVLRDPLGGVAWQVMSIVAK